MGGKPEANRSLSKYCRGKINVKSGCRTCKTRKVKCDEGRPACLRCVSTGRVCDGYGVWGGGGNLYGRRQQPDSLTALRPSKAFYLVSMNAEEKQHLEWFKCRTARKIPGIFKVTFWDTLLFQVSVNEPAVLHAVLTLSSVHKKEILDSDSQMSKQEQFMLQHYTKSISHLQPHVLSKDRSSIRVTLVTCVVFVCLEFLRGHFKTAQMHLKNGLKILKENQNHPTIGDDGRLLLLRTSHNTVDDWIAQVFCRLHVQVVLFEQTYDHAWLIMGDSRGYRPLISTYHSLSDVWNQMERILNHIFHLTREARQQQVSECLPLKHQSLLLRTQNHIKAELTQWLDTYETSQKDLERDDYGKTRGKRASPLLHTYHIMATIMADTCLYPNNESVFDAYTKQFTSLINAAVTLWKVGGIELQALSGYCLHMSRSIVDIGWIPPLYYTALKCRVHRIRVQAIRLLESHYHREGIWDSKVAACIAQKVMEIEERDFYRDVDTADDFLLSSSPGERDLSLPSLPQSYRIQQVKVDLFNGPKDNLLLFCKQKQSSGGWKVLLREYHVLSQCWTDGRTRGEAEI